MGGVGLGKLWTVGLSIVFSTSCSDLGQCLFDCVVRAVHNVQGVIGNTGDVLAGLACQGFFQGFFGGSCLF